MIFDIESNVFRFIELVEMEGIEQTEKNLFYGYAIKDEILFMIGNQIPCLLKFNMKNRADRECCEFISRRREKGDLFQGCHY